MRPEETSELAMKLRVWGDTYLCVHLFLSELSDRLDSFWGSLLELDSLESLVHVESVVTAGWLKSLSHLVFFL